MTAFANGGKVEVETHKDDWIHDYNPQWNWADFNYRIKQEPKKMVKLYKFAYLEGTSWTESVYFYEDDSILRLKEGEKAIRLDYTMIEVEE